MPVAYQKAVREQRLAAEISAAKRERDFYLSRVDKAKAVSAQQERKEKVHFMLLPYTTSGPEALLEGRVLLHCCKYNGQFRYCRRKR